MVRTTLICADGHRVSGEGLDLARNPPGDSTVWVDLIATTELGLSVLPTEWRFHPLALEDCLHPQRRAKYERFPTHTFIVLQALDTGTEADLDTTAVRIFVRPGLLVTVHDRPVSAISRVDELVRSDGERVGTGADRVLHAIFDAVIDEFIPLLDRWEAELDSLEAKADADLEASTLDELVAIRHRLLVMRRTMLPQQEVLKRILESTDLSETGAIYFRDVLDHIDAVSDSAALLVDVCAGAMQVQKQRADDRLNRVMKYLAMVSTLLLPMTVISGALGMNFDRIPHAESPNGFWHAVWLMVGIALVLAYWFRRKRWL